MEDTKTEREELAVALLLEAGRLMEDASPVFALALPDESAIVARISLLEQIGSNLSAFAAAARALRRVSDLA